MKHSSYTYKSMEYAKVCLSRSGVQTPEQLKSLLENPDRQKHYRLYEAACIVKFGLVPWEHLSNETLASRGLARGSGLPRGVACPEDIGVDCASPDLQHTMQCKWYGSGSRVKYTQVATFLTTSMFARAEKKTLVRPAGVKFSKGYVCANREEFFSEEALDEAEMFDILAPLLDASVPATAPAATALPPAAPAAPMPSAAPVAAVPLPPAADPATPLQSAAPVAAASLPTLHRPTSGSQPNALLVAAAAMSMARPQPAANPLLAAAGPLPGVVSPLLSSAGLPLPAAAPPLPAASPPVTATSTPPSAAGPLPAAHPPVVSNDMSAKLENLLGRLYPYQREAFERATEALRRGDQKILCEIGCGGGKSWILFALAMWWSITMRSPVVILVPSLVLLGQHHASFKELFDLDVGYVCGNGSLLAHVTIVTMNSIAAYTQAMTPGLVLCDEAHHVMQHEEGDGYLRLCADTVGQHVYFSATPPETDPKVVTPVAKMSSADLIENGHLTDYCVWIPQFDEGDYSESLATLISETPAWQRVLAYCNRIESCERLAALLCAANVPAVAMSGDMKIAERRRVFAELESGKIRCIVSVETISEGLDVPAADTCVFAEPRSSPRSIVQCVGRVLRLHPSKSIAHVVVPAMNAPALRIVMARLMAEYPRLEQAIKDKTPGYVTGIACIASSTKAELIQVDVYNSLGLALGGDLQWTTKYQLLQEYVHEFGVLPPQKAVYKGVTLGAWCNTQRQFYKIGKLSREDANALASISGWVWSVNDSTWQKRFLLLQEYVDEFKTLPLAITVYKKFNLGAWCNDQRRFFKMNKLPQRRIDMLLSIQNWVWDRQDSTWHNNYLLLQEYIREFGNLPSGNTIYRGVKLSLWCVDQRHLFKRGKLPQKRVNALSSISEWIWDPHDSTWQNNYYHLREYVCKFRVLPLKSTIYKDVKLGMWCNLQRSTFKKGNALPGAHRCTDVYLGMGLGYKRLCLAT